MPWLLRPQDVKHLRNKGPTIWFPPWAGLAALQISPRSGRPDAYRGGTLATLQVAPADEMIMSAGPAPGGTRS